MSHPRLALAVLAPLLMAAGPGPLGVTLLGSVKSTINISPPNALPANVCMINAIPNAAGSAFVPQGPALALYRRDRSSGPVALTLPALAYGTLTGTNAAPIATQVFAAMGGMRLKFATYTSGSISFLAGGTTQPNTGIAPSFNNYKAVWTPQLKRLTISFDLRLGKCAVPFVAGFEA